MDAILNAPQKRDNWLREPWMLLVLGGPILVVIAAIATGIIAWRSADKVVSNDYYRAGLQIDQDLQRDAKARIYNMQAQLQRDATQQELQLRLTGAAALPAVAKLSIASSANGLQESEAIYKINMAQVQPGLYQARLPLALQKDSQNWHIKISGDDWRLTQAWPRGQSQLQLKPQ